MGENMDIKKWLFVSTLIPALLTFSYGQKFSSRHFTIQKLANGIYAAIAAPGGHAICNAGIIDLGKSTLVFDPFMSPEAASDLEKAAIRLTGRRPAYVVNSHYHNDHVSGNQVFKGAAIISTATTRELMAKHLPQEMEDNKKQAPARLKAVMAAASTAVTPHQRMENKLWTGYYEALTRASAVQRLVLPGTTFKDRYEIRGSQRSVQLISYGTGHTPGDLIMNLPGEGVVFMGDLLFIGHHPWLGDGDMAQWREVLRRVASLHSKILVPGHGPVGGAAAIGHLTAYFDMVETTAGRYAAQKQPPVQDTAFRIPAPFDQWYLSLFFTPNIMGAYERRQAGGKRP